MSVLDRYYSASTLELRLSLALEGGNLTNWIWTWFLGVRQGVRADAVFFVAPREDWPPVLIGEVYSEHNEDRSRVLMWSNRFDEKTEDRDPPNNDPALRRLLRVVRDELRRESLR